MISAIPIALFINNYFTPESRQIELMSAPLRAPAGEAPTREMTENDYLNMRISDLEMEIARKNSTIDKLIEENKPGPTDVMMWISTFLLNMLSIFGIVRNLKKPA